VPTTPPRPVISGQLAGVFAALAAMASSTIATMTAAARSQARDISRLRISRQPQTANASTGTAAAAPKNWSATSAAMAPGNPMKLRIGKPEALFREGSLGA
jgi:hypothetical protein